MRRLIAWLLAVLCVGLLPNSAWAASGQAQWTRVDRIYLRSEGVDVATYGSGVYIAGNAESSPCAESQGMEFCSEVGLIHRYDDSGTLVWARSFQLGVSIHCLPSTRVTSIAVDASGVYVTGTHHGFIGPPPFEAEPVCPGETSGTFVLKYTHSGTHVWTRDSAGGIGIAVDASGVYVTGTTGGSFPGYQNAGSLDIFLRKYTTDGAVVWTRQAGTSGGDAATDVAISGWGLFVTGQTYGAWPGAVNERGDSDAFVLRYTRRGTLAWTRQFGSATADYPRSIAADGPAVYVGGTTAGTFPGQTSKGGRDGWVRKLGADGTLLWTRQFGTSGDESHSLGLVADSSGVFLTGGTTGSFPGYTRRGYSDAYMTSYSSTGSQGWTRQFGSPHYYELGGDWGRGIAIGPPPGDTQQDARQGVYVTGAWGAGSRDDNDNPIQHVFLRKHER